MPDVAQPVFELSSLASLCEETQNDAAVHRFVSTFLNLLPGRVSRILDALRARDVDLAMDAVLSLKVTSSMIGALRMEQLCHCVENALVGGDYDAAEGAGVGVEQHTSALVLALDTSLPGRFGHGRLLSMAT
ncbi:Hpt domain-containing protein [Paenarthrobacter sp. PH39-S1]|uniref:Hpt domain-containing protein n=1 Tax=Paenarthrobacter sp. PH39-S1 TaxID=3046204 RepID=UPI0024B9E6B6|nr:Hpt domain-containing protein [Paenarthrobacter sp. PH39-S1]MDJ0356102.1 Hpt domain-containing protein [Paenarthrobacter sp. PH39-S1]